MSDISKPGETQAGADVSGVHATLMDGIYRYQRHVYDFTRKYYLFGRDELIAQLEPPSGGTVLEVGCGTGRNLIKAARAYPEAQLYGIDISEEMLKHARRNIDRAGLSDRIALRQGDATNLDPAALFGRDRFDRVFFSYALSMIPPWEQAVEHASGMLAPKGRLMVVDFGDLDQLPGWFRSTLYRWLGAFHVTPRLKLEAVLTKLEDDSGASGLTAALRPLYRGYAWLGELADRTDER
jgi:S-adenosylmethionine-diacylgycerolhomoserine-N-methlytransferase